MGNFKSILIIFLSIGSITTFTNASTVQILGDSASFRGVELGKGELLFSLWDPLKVEYLYSGIMGGKSVSSLNWLEFDVLYELLFLTTDIEIGSAYSFGVEGLTGVKVVTPTSGLRIGLEPWFGGIMSIPLYGEASVDFMGELETLIGIGEPEKLTISCKIPISEPSIRVYSLWYHHFMKKNRLSIGLSFCQEQVKAINYSLYSLQIRIYK